MADVTISQLSTGTPNKDSAVIPYSDGSTTYKTSPSGIVAASPGAVLQVAYGYSNNTSKGNVNSWATCPGLSVSLTPRFNTSKIMIMASGTIGIDNTGGQEYLFRICRNGVEVTPQGSFGTVRGYAANSWDISSSWQIATTSMQYLDSPSSIESCTYTIQAYVQIPPSTGYTFYWNRTASSSESDSIGACSSITLMEIAG